jgi:hypothetical protein
MEKGRCHQRVGRSRLWHKVWYVLDRDLLNMEKGHCHQRVGRSRLWQELTKNMKYGEGALSSESWKK